MLYYYINLKYLKILAKQGGHSQKGLKNKPFLAMTTKSGGPLAFSCHKSWPLVY